MIYLLFFLFEFIMFVFVAIKNNLSTYLSIVVKQLSRLMYIVSDINTIAGREGLNLSANTPTKIIK